MGDVVFLGPSDTRKSSNESFSIFKHAEPDLRDLLAKSLEISYCVALKLPGDTNLEDLAKLFHVSLERYGLYIHIPFYLIKILDIQKDFVLKLREYLIPMKRLSV